eukprot:6179594-Pleurochrysis_carterae.AAC.1
MQKTALICRSNCYGERRRVSREFGAVRNASSAYEASVQGRRANLGASVSSEFHNAFHSSNFLGTCGSGCSPNFKQEKLKSCIGLHVASSSWLEETHQNTATLYFTT